MSTVDVIHPPGSTPGAGAAGRAGSRRDALADLSRRMVYLGMTLLPMLSVRVTHNLTLSDFVFALAAVVLALSMARPTIRRPVFDGWYAGSFLMLLGGITSAFVAASASGTLQVVGNAVYVFFVWQWVTRSTLDTDERRVAAMTAFIVGCTLSSVVAVVRHAPLGGRAVGLGNQPDLLGVTNALGIVMAVGLILWCGRGRWWHRPICILLMALALVLSSSVSGMVCTLAGCVLLVVRKRVRLKTVGGIALGVVLAYLLGLAALGSHAGKLNLFARLHATTTQGSGANTISTRQATWDNAWAGIERSPVWGHGLDPVSATTYYDPYLAEPTGLGSNPFPVGYTTHNVVLLFWYEGGILWLAGGVMAVAAALRRVTGGGGRDPVRGVLLVAILVVVLYAMQAPELVDRWFWLPMVLAMTLPRAAARGDRRVRRWTPGTPPRAAAAVPTAR